MRSFLEQFQQQRGLTLRELAQRLGYSSKTSILRMMDGNVTPATLLEFARRLQQNFPLDEQELWTLQRAVDMKHYGPEVHKLHTELFLLCTGQAPWPRQPLHLRQMDGSGDTDLLQRYRQAERVEITLLGCLSQAVYPALKTLLQRPDVQVRQYITSADRVSELRALRAADCLLFCERYELYFRDSAAADPMDVDNLMLSHYWLHGEEWEDFVVFHSATEGMLANRPGDGSLYPSLIDLRQEGFTACKRVFSQGRSLEQFIDYAASYEQLERDHATLMLKPDISANFIPVQLLLAAMDQRVMPPAIMEELSQVYRERNENVFHKRKHSYVVLKQDAMASFARTGRFRDHFFAMRAFAPEERRLIFDQLCEMMRRNNCLHIHFLRKDAPFRNINLTFYEGEGLLMLLRDDSHYDFSAGHTEIALRHPSLDTVYPGFFREKLVRSFCLDETESLAVMLRLAAQCG